MSACSTSQTSTLSKSDRAAYFLSIANGSVAQGDYRSALEFIGKAQELDSSLPEIYHLRGLVYFHQKNPEDAIKQFQKAIELDPKNSVANNSLGKVLIDMGRGQEAIKPLEVAAQNELFAERYKPYTNLGITYYRMGNNLEARKAFERATIYGEDSACVAHYYLGHLFLKENKYRDAVKSYEKATMKFCTGFEDAHLALGIAYEQARNYQAARVKFLEVKTRFPESKVAEKAIEHLRYLP